MDVMEARRSLLMMAHGFDTSPIILQYNTRYNSRGELEQNNVASTTEIYHFDSIATNHKIIHRGLAQYFITYKNNGSEFLDYWSTNSQDTESEYGVINAGADAIAATIYTSEINDCYLYDKVTGQIFFAGKNSIYYGHCNISELE